MKNIKSYKVFESAENIKFSDDLNIDPFLKEWRMKIKVDEDMTGFMGDEKYDVTTPYGERLELGFYKESEYTGEGDWNLTSTATDQYEIEYVVYGRSKSYTYPDEVYWDEDKAFSRFTEDFKAVKFIDDMIDKDPLICSKIYDLAPENIKKDIYTNLEKKGIDPKVLRGGSLMNRLLNK